MTPASTLLLNAVLRLMHPLVRMLLREGVGYPAFAAALKPVFLDAARAELGTRDMAATDSALSLLSGVHRRDVRRLTREASSATTQDASLPRSHSLAGEVVARWMSEPPWLDADERPRVLPRSGELSFDALVDGVSRDVRPRAVLDELLRLGLVQEDGEQVALAAEGFAPRQGQAEMAALMADNLHDHAAAARANLQDGANFLEQAVYVDDIGAASVEALHRESVAAWRQSMRVVLRQARQRFDADARELPPEARRHRVRFGAYFYSEQESS